jgi:hypothetical protein
MTYYINEEIHRHTAVLSKGPDQRSNFIIFIIYNLSNTTYKLRGHRNMLEQL